MATVKIKYNASAKDTLRYVFRHGMDGDPVDSHGCGQTESLVVHDFEAVRNAFHSHKGNEVAHIMQNWGPEESAKLTLQEVNQMGVDLVSRSFPGHQFVVVTHSDRPHLHNHIVVNSVNMENGKRIHNKIKHWKDLTQVNDEICRSRGLSIPDGERRERALRMSDGVRGMLKHNRFSYIFDMAQKADFARAYATSYVEYVGILAEMKVGVRVEEKNISYYYGGTSVAIRGKQLGKRYDKAGLEGAFKANDAKFQRAPGLREQIRGTIDTLRSAPGAIDLAAQQLMRDNPGAIEINVKKDYSAYPRVPRRESKTLHVGEHDLAGSIIPIDEIKRARRSNIITYCKMKGIGLAQNEKGEWTLKGKDYVIIKDYEWINRKNRTTGSLIELVASHKNMTFLQAVADITCNPKLLLVEQHFGEQKRRFSPFYMPKRDHASRTEALTKIVDLLGSMRLGHHHAEHLLRSQQVQVSKGGVIRFFGKDSGEGALEFVQDDLGRWSRREHGRFSTPFAAVSGKGRSATVYTDPFSYLGREGANAMSGRHGKHPVLALLTPDIAAVGKFLAENPHVDHINVVTPTPKHPSPVELDFFNNLKTHYLRLGIELDLVGPEHAGRGRGPEISF